MANGGARPGAGRPKGSRNKPKTAPDVAGKPPESRNIYPDAESYLAAVVEGREAPDPVRVQAAKTLILYQRPKLRAPVKSPRPSQLAEREQLSKQTEAVADFAERAEEIRRKHRKGTS